MRRRVLAIGLWLGFAASGGTPAGAATSWEASVGGGVAIPFDEFADNASTGWLVNPRLGIYVRPTLCIGVEYGYHSFDGRALGSIPGDPRVGLDYRVHQCTGFAKALFTPELISPYLRLQGGVYQKVLIVSYDTSDGSYPDTQFGMGFGGGIQVGRQGAVGAFADAILHIAFEDADTTTWVGIQGGITILFGPRP